MKTSLRLFLLAVFAVLFVGQASGHYNPQLGRWLSRDPLGEAGGFNLYAYCGNDPVNKHDPLGLMTPNDWEAKKQFDQLIALSSIAERASKLWNRHSDFEPWLQPGGAPLARKLAVEKWRNYIAEAGLTPVSMESVALVNAYDRVINRRDILNKADGEQASDYFNSAGAKWGEMGDLALEFSGTNSFSRALFHWNLVAGTWDYDPVGASLDVILIVGLPEVRGLSAVTRYGSSVLRFENRAIQLERIVANTRGDFMASGQLGGMLFPEYKIPSLVNYLEKRGIQVHEGINGSFSGVKGIMTLPRNPTVLNVKHELSHFLDWMKYKDDYYKLFTQAEREQMVLDRLKNNRIWDELNDAERAWSLQYPSSR
jgi:hypothetical protein